MADLFDSSVRLAVDGRPTPEFESYWHGATLLTAGEPDMDINLQVFKDGLATDYLEALWNDLATALSKNSIDVSVILEVDGYATPEMEAFWEELIT